ncbi:MAG: hypothetical protein RL272_800 [Candidatus Parcubacteria bacterium]|jgi:hypothetical protein
MSETAADAATQIAENFNGGESVLETPPESPAPETPEAAEAAPETPAESGSPFESASSTVQSAIETFEQGADAEGFEEAAKFLDSLGLLEPIEDEAGDDFEDDDELDPEDFDDPRDLAIAQLQREMEAMKNEKQTEAQQAAQEQAWQAFSSDMKDALGEDLAQDDSKWTPEQKILGALGLHVGDVAEAKKIIEEHDTAMKVAAVKEYLEGKADFQLPPEVSRTAKETVGDEGLSPQAAIAQAGQRIARGVRQ